MLKAFHTNSLKMYFKVWLFYFIYYFFKLFWNITDIQHHITLRYTVDDLIEIFIIKCLPQEGQLTHPSSHLIIFLVMRTFHSYSLCNFEVYHRVLLSMVAMTSIRSAKLTHLKLKVSTLPPPHLLSSLARENHLPPGFYDFGFLIVSTCDWFYMVFLSLSHLFHLA